MDLIFWRREIRWVESGDLSDEEVRVGTAGPEVGSFAEPRGEELRRRFVEAGGVPVAEAVGDQTAADRLRPLCRKHRIAVGPTA
ncbi:hypothetical protein AB0L04_13435 [Streptomyces glaucescens]|uniref:hypothetical protein n=1 Tax=Streptomyces glaucescens TaxID=1907 RepID=UPI00344BDA6F